jgi:small ligand-binding sensory domain FIST
MIFHRRDPIASDQKYRPTFQDMDMKEFTFRAVLLGLVMTVIRRGQRLFGSRGHDHRGHLPGGGDRDGGPATL